MGASKVSYADRVALAIFALTYLLISGVRLPFLPLDRAGGALIGAVLMLALGVVSPRAAQQAIDVNTLVLLFGMMLLSNYLAAASFFQVTAHRAITLAHRPRVLLVAVALVSAFLSAFIVNDTVCLMLTPLVLEIVERTKLPPLPYLLAICMASNSGSAATFTGNPQNMLIGTASHLSYAHFAAFMFLPAVLATLVVIGVLLTVFRRELTATLSLPSLSPPTLNRPLLTKSLLVLLAVVIAFFAGASMSLSALFGAAALIFLARQDSREQLERVDYVLLVFFASLFVVVFGVNQAGWGEQLRTWFSPLLRGGEAKEMVGLGLLSLVASNLVSNVPFVMLARDWIPAFALPRLQWETLALSSTLAGNLTLVGSVANLIVFELARKKIRCPFATYLKVGVPATLLSLALGLSTLWLEHRLFD